MKTFFGMTLAACLALGAWLGPVEEAGACSCPPWEGESTSIVSMQLQVPGDTELFEREQARWSAIHEVTSHPYGAFHPNRASVSLFGYEHFSNGYRRTRASFATPPSDTGLRGAP